MPVLPTLAYDYREGCVIFVGGASTPTEPDWRTYVQDLDSWWRPDRTNLALVLIGQGMPTPAQREDLKQISRSLTIRSAIITDSLFTRSTARALSWFNPGFRAFSYDGLPNALAYLGLEPQQGQTVWQGALELLEASRAAAPRSAGQGRP